jgi:hypothetical protein
LGLNAVLPDGGKFHRLQRNANRFEDLRADEFTNRFTMIVGDINSGKTTLTQKILAVYCRATGGTATVVDLAPEIRPRDREAQNKTMAIGGVLQIPDLEGVRSYRPRIYPPRLRARSESEAEALAAENLRTIDTLIEKALPKDTDAIFINDCSLYLHAGSAAKLLGLIQHYPTSVVNGYFGRFFGSGPISIREKSGMESMIRHCDRLIKLP